MVTIVLSDLYIDTQLCSDDGSPSGTTSLRDRRVAYLNPDDRRMLVDALTYVKPDYNYNYDPNWRIRCIDGYIYNGFWVHIPFPLIPSDEPLLRRDNALLRVTGAGVTLSLRDVVSLELSLEDENLAPKPRRVAPKRRCRFKGSYKETRTYRNR